MGLGQPLAYLFYPLGGVGEGKGHLVVLRLSQPPGAMAGQHHVAPRLIDGSYDEVGAGQATVRGAGEPAPFMVEGGVDQAHDLSRVAGKKDGLGVEGAGGERGKQNRPIE